ncbi:MAG TPA: SpoIIIAH-like family protein [Candidatus Anaerobutyricum stercoris]|uniref:SpoIIIAH-like family protein n=1 Tax=Candidatus Anaerobutyricum stercoris TaxID=2838457 RepID=A0A9D2EM18_9FIRM|nr:SpoIIIAH-like family protein [Candidatus Anaerobutyricum stercoris]
MKKIFKSNQIAITSLAIMIAVAGYLNFTKSEAPSTASYENAEESLDTIDTMDISDGDSLISEKVDDEIPTEETETIGDAVLTQAQVGEYVAGAKMEREQTRSKTRDSLNEIIENESLSDSEKEDAVAKLTKLAEVIEKEAEAEQLLDTKGYGDSVVSIGEDSVDVVLNYNELSQADRAQIEDIVTRKTGCTVSQIVISRMNVSGS